jgi:putative membrane protein
MFYMQNLGWGWWLVMSVGMVALWALVIFGVVALARGGFGARDRESRAEAPSASAVDILDRRLASGELSVEEYEERRAVLQGKERIGAPL